MARLIDDLLRYQLIDELKTAIGTATKRIGEYIEASFEQTRERFYNHYSPTSYSRTDGFYLSRKDASSYWKALNGGSTYIAGIEGGSQYIPAGNYRANTDWVWMRTWAKGIHGWTKAELNTWKEAGKYPFIGIKSAPTVQRPSPRQYMNTQFNIINIRIVGNILNSEIGKVLKNG